MISVSRQTHDPPNGARIGEPTVYAFGDIHGCYDLLHVLLREVRSDAAADSPGVSPLVIFLGDYVDRGPASAKVLAALAWLRRSSAVDARMLEGNHDEMLRIFLEHPTQHEEWLTFGGRETLSSYGILPPSVRNNPDELVILRDALLDVLPLSHYTLFQNLELMVEIGDYAFVHAGVMPGVALKDQHRDDLLWIRDDFLNHPRPATSVIVHGHTWQSNQPTLLPHRLGIDTGAYETGVLTALKITDEQIEVIQALHDT